MLNNIEKGDTVAIKREDGRTCNVTVLSVKADYEHTGGFVRFDYIDYNEPSPMRRTAYPKELIAIIKKTVNRAPDPKASRPGDGVPAAAGAIVINGKVYIQKTTDREGEVPVNLEANKQVHEAVTKPAKPVTSRIHKHASKEITDKK